MKRLLCMMLSLCFLGLTACAEPTREPSSSEPSVSETSEDPGASSEPGEPEDPDSSSGSTSSQKKTTTAGKKTTKKTTAKTTAGKTKATTTRKTKTTTGGNSAMQKEKEAMLNQKKIPVAGSESNLNTYAYRLGENGLIVREAVINSGKGGDPVEIVHIADSHFTLKSPQLEKLEACMKYGSYFDYTVLGGDIIDSCNGELMDQLSLLVMQYPNTLAVLGNHELMGSQTTPEKYSLLKKKWPNNVYYCSKVLKNKVMLVAIDNAQESFTDSEITSFKADIEKARKNGYAILLFVHVPLCTKNPAEKDVVAFLETEHAFARAHYNFYTGQVGGQSAGINKKMRDVIGESGDVIKGVFCGHLHSAFYTEIVSKTPSGTEVKIPQYISSAAYADNGHVLKITVK